jgi:hypothetical protein
MSASPIDIVRSQLAFHITSPTMDLPSARQAAAQLDGPRSPIILDLFAGQPSLPRVQLLNPPAPAAFRFWPQALFQLRPKLSVADLPPLWVPAYLDWAGRLKRSRQIAKTRTRMADAIRQGFNDAADLTNDPVIAALLLFEFGPAPKTELRGTLMRTALAQPLGAYICAEALHTAEERDAIMGAAAGDSQILLGISRLPEFARDCLRLAASRQDLSSGLIVATLGTDAELAGWLRQTGLAAFQDAAAAGAMLVLNPQAPESLRDGWLATLHQPEAHGHAFSTARWARYTWTPSPWAGLRDLLKPVATVHGQGHWFNWFAQIEPESAAAGLAMPADPLWSLELVQTLDLDDEALRFRLADELGKQHHLPEASMVLSALNHRGDLRRQGELH